MSSLALLFGAVIVASAPFTPSHSPADSGAARRAPVETFSGRSGQISPRPPRLDEINLRLDAVLDEPQWDKAALLTGFSQFFPRDGIPAEDSTQVLVWYSATAIHFGVRAFEPHAAVQATLANRDRIFSDDRIELLLGTFRDGRQAVVLGVNPLGIQMDGTLVESNQARMGGSGSGTSSRDFPDLNPDFVFESKGRLTEFGYEVEIRVPFKSLKYSSANPQTWGFNVVRVVQHSGREDSWAPATRATASFLAQSGTLEAMTDLRRGIVLDVTPEVTARVTGAPAPLGGRWGYDSQRAKVGGTLRWGVTNNWTMNGTVNPDFSQIESDASQVQFDPRQAVFYAEKRPFFLDGTEYFSTPKSLVYTKRIVQPVVATKLTGKRGRMNLGFLAAVDDTSGSLSGRENPFYAMARVQRDLGRNSRVAMTLTDREEGSRFNRVASVDARHVFGSIYSASAQYAQASTRLTDGGTVSNAPLWNAVLSRNGRKLAMRWVIDAVDERFRTQSGFIGRGGITTAVMDQRYTHYLAPGGFLESISFNPLYMSTWRYSSFVHQGDAIEKKLHNRVAVTARGGWSADVTHMTETFGFDPALYARYRVLRGQGDTLAFVGTPRIGNRDIALSMNTPRWKHVSAGAYYLWGDDENFYEWAPARILFANFHVEARPTERLRAELQYQRQSFVRETDGSSVGEIRIPRMRVEYQLARPLFVRLVGEYASNVQDALRDDGRTNLPLLINGRPSPAQRDASFRGDALLSYRPVPGTLFFLGYGAGFADTRERPEQFNFPGALGLRGFTPQNNVFYVKASYLYRQ